MRTILKLGILILQTVQSKFCFQFLLQNKYRFTGSCKDNTKNPVYSVLSFPQFYVLFIFHFIYLYYNIQTKILTLVCCCLVAKSCTTLLQPHGL